MEAHGNNRYYIGIHRPVDIYNIGIDFVKTSDGFCDIKLALLNCSSVLLNRLILVIEFWCNRCALTCKPALDINNNKVGVIRFNAGFAKCSLIASHSIVMIIGDIQMLLIFLSYH